MRETCAGPQPCTVDDMFNACSRQNLCFENDTVMFHENLCCCLEKGHLAIDSREKCNIEGNCLTDRWMTWTPFQLTECIMSIAPAPPPRDFVVDSTVMPDDCLLCLVADGFTCTVASQYTIDWGSCNEDCWRSIFLPNHAFKSQVLVLQTESVWHRRGM